MTIYTAPLGTQYTLVLTVVLAAQNTTANSSRVNWSLVARKNTGSGYWTNDVRYWSAVIGPNTPSGSIIGYDFRNYTQLVLGEGSYDVAHNANGTLTIPVSGTFIPQNAPALDTGTASGSFALPTISRATQPSVSPSPTTVGSTVTINLPRANAAYKHNVTWVAGSYSGTIGTGLDTTVDWTVPETGLAPIVITADTRNGASSIGTRTTTLAVRLPPATPDPTALTFPFDIRARLVTYEGGVWRPRRTIPATDISMVAPHSATATCSITLSRLAMDDMPDYSVVQIDIQDGTKWVTTGLRFVLNRVEDDNVDPSGTVTYSGISLIDYLLSFGYAQVNHELTNSNPGAVMHLLVGVGHTRGWAPIMHPTFSPSLASGNVPYTNTGLSREISAGTPFSQVLEGLVSDGLAEYDSSYNNNTALFNLYNPGTGSDWAVAGADPVIDLSSAPLTSAPRRGTNEKVITRVSVAGDGDIQRTRERAADDPVVFGQLEGWVAASGVTDDAEADRIGDNALSNARTPTNERTFVYSANAAQRRFWPYVSMRPGDWVRIPGVAEASPERARIGQITMAKGSDGEVTVTILTGDRILTGTGALAKRQQASTGGSIAGGSLQAPATIDARIPAATTIAAVTSTGYWNSDGAAKSNITLSWGAITTSLTGSALAVDYYEIWTRPDLATPWSLLTVSADTSVSSVGWDVNRPLHLRVRGRSAAGIFGEWSLYTEHVTNEPTIPLGAPGTPVVTANDLGTIFIEWAGLIGGAAAPKHLAYTRAEISLSPTGPWSPAGAPLLSAGSASIDPGGYGTFYTRLRAVDRLGLEGTASAVVTITTIDPGLIQPVPKSPTGLVYTTDVDFSLDGSTLLAWFDAAWDAVTLDVDDEPLDVYGYEIWGRPSTETDMRLMGTTDGLAIRVLVDPGSEWTLKVRAISDTGARGDFSASIEATADGVVEPLDPPTTPTVTSTRGLLKIAWDGLLDTPLGDEPPANSFRFVFAEYAEVIDGELPVWTRAGTSFTRGGGTIYIPAKVGAEFLVRLAATAGDGVSGSYSAEASATIVGIDLIDFTPIIENMLTEPRIETSEAADEGVKLYNGGIVAYNAAGEPTVFINAEDGSIYFSNGVIDGDAIVEGSIIATRLDAASLITTLIASELGESLNLASNESVNILVGDGVAGVQADADNALGQLEDLQTYYQFTNDGAYITSPDSIFAVKISSNEISMLSGSNAVSTWNAAGLTADSLIASKTATIGAHQFRKEGARTTIRPL